MASCHDDPELGQLSGLEVTEADEIDTGQFHAITEAQIAHPVQREPSTPPLSNFLETEEVKKLSSVQEETRSKVSSILMLLTPPESKE